MEFINRRGGPGVPSRKRKQWDVGSRRVKRLRGLLDSTVMVRNVQGLTEEHLNDYFQNYGDVAQVRLVEDPAYAFVTFQAKETAQGVIAALSSNEGIIINGIHKKVQVSWAAAGLPKDSGSSSSQQRSDIFTKRKKNRNHLQGFRRRCKSRLFISAVASAVASSGASIEGNLPRPSTSVDVSKREVIAYDDWL